MKNSIKILFGLALAAITSQAQALLITPTTIDGALCTSTTCWSGDVPNNPNAAEVSTITGVADLVSLYKAEVPSALGDPIVEEGPFASSYDTTFGTDPIDPNNALIEYVSGAAISCPECFLLVKDGNNSPTWYIFDIGSWDGLADIDIRDFWTDRGAISHVTIFGNSSNVAEPGMAALLSIGLLGMVVARRRMKV